MAKDVKPKEKVIERKYKGSVGKVADRAKIVSVKAKDAIIVAKDKVRERANNTEDCSPEQYATDKIAEGMHKTAEDAIIVGDKVVKSGVRKVKEKKADKKAQPEKAKFQTENNNENSVTVNSKDKQKKPKQRKQQPPKTRGELSVKKPKVEQKPVKYAHSGENKIKQTTRGSVNTRNTIKTADTTFKNAQKSEKAVKKSAQLSAKAAKKAEEAAKTTVKAVGKAIVETGKATVAAAKGAKAAIAAGGVPAVVLVVVICLLAAVGGTCFGIFLSNDKTTGSKMTMTQAISQLTTDYYTDLEDFKSNYEYDQYEIKTASGNIVIDWKTVLAVYAVKTTTATDGFEVVTIDDNKYKLLKTVVNDMNPKSGQVTNKSIPIVTVTTDENGVSIKKTTYETKKVLTITVGNLSANEICDFYRFNAEQKAMLYELLSDEYTELWDELINASGAIILPNGSVGGSGKFAWPVAGDYSITSRFGTRVDPISGAVKTHGGTDIAAAQGTPIVAAADGTVIVATYNAGGYGYYVKIQHDGTYSTLYGHCSALLVSAGQTVKQGQVIAKVGSTGYSTGPHCHFEVIQNGIRVDALSFYE